MVGVSHLAGTLSTKPLDDSLDGAARVPYHVRGTKEAHMADDGTKAASYIPYKTLTNTLDRFRSGHLPNRIDRTVFPGQSGAAQTQLLAAMKFLGLIDEELNTPTDVFKKLVPADEATRKKLLRGVLETSYAELFKLDLLKATPGQLNETMAAHYTVSGSTLVKAVRFFVAAATDVGIELSPLLSKQKVRAGNGAAPRRRRGPRLKQPQPLSLAPASPASGTTKTVELKSGGTLTVSGTFDPFSLNSADRAFVFGLIDKLDEYQNTTGS